MAEQTTAPTAPKAKTAAELHKEYQSLAAECTKLAQGRPAHVRKVQAEVQKQLGDFDKKMEALKAKKRTAYVAYEAAVAAEFKAAAK
jgi:hypothetical protein